jgi:molybdate transport system substrate-binding protein
MQRARLMLRGAVALALAALLLASAAQAAELRVVSSGGFAAAYRALLPTYERAGGNSVVTEWGPSMGATPQAIPQRLARGEPIDVVIMAGDALATLIKEGKVRAESRVDLARSLIAVAVRAGAAKPDISSSEAVKRALLGARSIAYSDSASGVYLSTELFARLGIADAIREKSRMIPAEPVGQVIARGEAELGFQQMSELLPVAGIDIVGKLPAELQKVTVFSAGIVVTAKEPEAAASLIAFLASPAAEEAVTKSGLEPMVPATPR